MTPMRDGAPPATKAPVPARRGCANTISLQIGESIIMDRVCAPHGVRTHSARRDERPDQAALPRPRPGARTLASPMLRRVADEFANPTGLGLTLFEIVGRELVSFHPGGDRCFLVHLLPPPRARVNAS